MKGQAWAEYIIILAVVVTMAAVAMYIAGGFMGTNQQISERDSAAYWASADVAITRYHVNSSVSQLVIKNNKNFRINVTAISSGGSGSLIAPGGTNSIVLDPGQSAQVNVTRLNCSAGVYSLVLIVNYTDARYGTKYSLYGEKPLVGLCTDYYAPPQCTSDADCSFNSSPCNTYCNVSLSQLCTFATNPAICQRTCSEGKCFGCQASCGTATCTGCGVNTTNCPVAYCNGNQNCTYPPSTSCSIPCPVDACGSCNTPACVATCTNCPPSAQICTGNGNCVACNNNGTCDTSLGENYTNCPADCCGSGMYACSDANNMTGKCRSGCSGFNCLNFKQVCDNQPWSASRCSNSTGGSSGSLDYYVGGCCNGTVYYCGSGKTCNQTSSSTTNCITKCLPDCTSGDNICHSSCSGSCLNFKDACDAVGLNFKACSNVTGGTANPPLNYYVTCCNGTVTSCGINTTNCPANYCNGNIQYTYPANSSCNISCSNGSCTSCIPACTATAGTNCSNTSYCSGGTCVACTGDMRNCDLNPANGCEVNISSNSSNCGSCGHACNGGQVCQSGVCVTPVTCPNGACDSGETYLTCPQDCCENDCTAKYDLICHSECSPYCTGFQTACNNQNKSTKVCSDLTHNVTCCNSVSICPSGGTCQGGNCLLPFCGDGICNGAETQTTCCVDCGCAANRYCCDCGAGCACRTSNQCRVCDYC